MAGFGRRRPKSRFGGECLSRLQRYWVWIRKIPRSSCGVRLSYRRSSRRSSLRKNRKVRRARRERGVPPLQKFSGSKFEIMRGADAASGRQLRTAQPGRAACQVFREAWPCCLAARLPGCPPACFKPASSRSLISGGPGIDLGTNGSSRMGLELTGSRKKKTGDACTSSAHSVKNSTRCQGLKKRPSADLVGTIRIYALNQTSLDSGNIETSMSYQYIYIYGVDNKSW